MKNELRELLKKLRQLKPSERVRTRCRSAIAIIIVFITTYTLIMPAVALERNNVSDVKGLNLSDQSAKVLNCHFPVHQHTEECYKKVPEYDAGGRKTGTKKVLNCWKADWIVHEHDENCYENGVLVCQLPEYKEHKHDASCYTMQRVLACGKEETPGHQHTDACYQTTQNIACGMEEHRHSDKCYSDVVTGTEKKLVCGYDEGEEISPAVYSDPVIDEETGETIEPAHLVQDAVVHHHTDSCYETETKTERQLTCGLTEHVHSNACYQTERKLICGQTEGKGHTHTDACYKDKKVLTCTELTPHRHTVDCYEKGPKGESPVDMGWVTITYDEYGNKILNGDPDHLICGKIELLKHQHDDGCFENTAVADTENTENIAAGEAGIPENGTAGDADLQEDGNAGEEEFHENDITFDENGNPIENSNGDDTSIEGQDDETPSGLIVLHPDGEEAQADDSEISEDAEAENADEEDADTEEKDAQEDADGESADTDDTEEVAEKGVEFTKTIEVEGASYSLIVSGEEACGIPENAVFKATAISENRDDYDEYREKALAAVDNYTTDEASRAEEMPGLFDLTIYDEDGNEIQPAAPLSISIDLGDAIGEDASGVYAVHFPGTNADTVMQPASNNPAGKAAQVISEKIAGTGTEVIETKTEDDGAVQFEAESLSVYAIVYTVDFHWEVDGKEYYFSIPGGGFVSFRQLVEVLGLADRDTQDNQSEILENTEDKTGKVNADTPDAENIGNENEAKKLTLEDIVVSETTQQFVEDVVSIKFSTPELLFVRKAENDITVGAIKDGLGLECEYSADLTEEQIAQINAQTVETGDWALISKKPFLTEEALTVTMKNGEVFTIRVTDGQITKHFLSANGDTYEITVTYDDSAQIPDDAELRVREINDTEKEFAENVEVVNQQLKARKETDVTHPVQFDISIFSGGVEVEPKEGSVVNVKVELMSTVFEDADDLTETDESEGEIWYNGEKLEVSAGVEERQVRIAHITENGTAEIIENVKKTEDESDAIVLQFATESFSDYLFDGNNGNGLYNLPTTIYVGDEIYMWNQANYWVSNIGSVVTETKHTNQGSSDNFKTVTAISTGTFRIYNRYNQNEYREITVLPARTGTTPPGQIETIDNATIGLTLNLFDYDLDNYLDDYFNGSSHYDAKCIADFASHGINYGNALKFWGSGIGNNYGSLNQYVEHGVTSIVNSSLNSSGYPTLSNNSGGTGNRDLSYLFTPSDGTDKKAYTNVDGLFKKDGDYYVYDSNTNYAYYDTSQGNEGRFAVYNSTYNQKSGKETGSVSNKAIGFFPFHKWDSDYDLYVNWNKNLNHHFGMSMSVDFSLPKDPKAVKDSAGNPIVFEFSGDDDLWVFIDGKLAMDIGGIHQPTSGTINFAEKKVTVNGQQQNFDFSKLYDGKKHTLQVFYIERGGCDSNCKIKFNMTQYGDVEFDKVDEDDQSILLSGAVFGLYKDDKCTQPLTEELKDGSRRAFIVETDERGHAKLEDVPLGDYYLKEIHAPDGYPIAVGSDTVRVRVYLDASGNVKTSVGGKETDAKITNKKPANINLGLKKEWQDADGQTIAAPNGVNATFEIKRNRTYETYTERPVQGHGEEASHLVVGWLHNNEPHIYEEFDLVAGSQATVSWSLVDGYTGTIGSIVNGTTYTKSPNPNHIYSQAITMPAAGQTTMLYIIDESDHGNAIKNINVAGSQFYGNSGGGFIHEFQTVTEPDPDFSYNGEHMTDNQVTLPINVNTWQYEFSELPALGSGTVIVDGKQQKVTYKYSYYIEEVSSTAPDGTTVIYEDLKGDVINSPTDAETHTSGTETVINKVPYGYLQIKKEVTYNGSSENLTTAQKAKLAGEYKFKIYKKEQCAAEDAVQDPNAAADAADKDLIVTITIGTDGKAVVGPNTPVKLLVGKYWIKEVESSNPGMFPVNNPIAVTVTKDHTSDHPIIQSLTNNYDENNGPDKIAIDIEKKFSGLDNVTQVPQNFEVQLQYTVNGQTKTVTLRNTELATGENEEKITWTHSSDGFTWHWRVTNIPSEATNFKIKEVNYDKAKGYDWKSATLNGNNITSTVGTWHDLTITAPAAELNDVTNDRRTSDSGQNTVFYLEDDDILLTKLTANQGTLVISKYPLNLVERDAVVKGWPQQGGFKTPPHYFSIEEHPNGFSYGDKTVTFGLKNGRTIVKFTQNASAQEAVFAVSYSSQDARNNANLVNTYKEVPVTIDIIKIDENDNTKKLPGAVFTLRQIADKAPTADGTLETLGGTTPTDSDPTDTNGKTSFSNLTHGYYEISEKTSPDGYVLSGDATFYFKIESGAVKWLVKGSNKPSEWEEKAEKADGEIVDFDPAHPAVVADPENNVEAQSAKNATFTVENEPGAALPSTGGPGTRIFAILGSLMILFAGAVLLRRRIL